MFPNDTFRGEYVSLRLGSRSTVTAEVLIEEEEEEEEDIDKAPIPSSSLRVEIEAAAVAVRRAGPVMGIWREVDVNSQSTATTATSD